jgi:ectoine hydroxylase-related dioxygenase (phytanoyl-CoA dioxygenase family)
LAALSFAKHGVEIRKGVLGKKDIDTVASDISLESDTLKKTGIRNLEKKFASIAMLAAKPEVLAIVSEVLQSPAHLVRAIFFDKTPEKNWFVSWHQDKTVALNRRVEMEGWGPWSVKDGVCHVQPPRDVLDRMLTIRLHVDPSDEESGCLRVIPSSHRSGILKQKEIEHIVKSHTAIPCIAAAGDAVIMRPHVLHSSRKSTGRHHRRVVHLEYSDYQLPKGIHWA